MSRSPRTRHPPDPILHPPAPSPHPPGPDELVDAGDIDEPVPHGQFLELLALMHALKARREARGLSLTDVSERSGLTRAAVSRLENGWNANPTLDTFYRYALALDDHIAMKSRPLEGTA